MCFNYTLIPDLSVQFPKIPGDSIISRCIYRDDQLKTILFAFAAGQELSEHTAAQAATLHFIQGEADLTLGDEAVTVHSGAWVHMPPHLPHSLIAKTPVVMLLTMFKPAG